MVCLGERWVSGSAPARPLKIGPTGTATVAGADGERRLAIPTELREAHRADAERRRIGPGARREGVRLWGGRPEPLTPGHVGTRGGAGGPA